MYAGISIVHVSVKMVRLTVLKVKWFLMYCKLPLIIDYPFLTSFLLLRSLFLCFEKLTAVLPLPTSLGFECSECYNILLDFSLYPLLIVFNI